MMMETTMYQDDGIHNHDSVKVLKKNMTLDFCNVISKQKKVSQLLQSPDLQMLKLASPELEKMIIQASGLVTTTPTPTQYIFPKFVTEEQENYAKGFLEALNDLHKHPQSNSGNVTSTTADLSTILANISDNSSKLCVKQDPDLPLSLTTTTELPGGLTLKNTDISSIISTNFPTTVTSLSSIPKICVIKEEPQIVPCLGGTPPMSPINMESQERIKLERKRARNRVAARKCRTRKLERISRLEDRVSQLKGHNSNLSQTAGGLKDEITRLKQQIVSHVNSGCQIMLTDNINF